MKLSLNVMQSLFALTAALLLICGRADAAFITAMCDDVNCAGGNDIIVTDNGPGDVNAGAGAVQFSVSAFGYALVVHTGKSKPAVGSASSPEMVLDYSATSQSGGGGTIYLYAVDTNFSGVVGSPLNYNLSLSGTNSGNSGTVSGNVYGGNTNNNFPNAFVGQPLIGSVGPLSGGAIAGLTTGSFTPNANPFSLALQAVVTRNTAGTSTGELSFSASATQTPEPATLSLLGACLAGLSLTHYRRLDRNR